MLEDYKQEIEQQLADLRAIQYLLDSSEFLALYKSSQTGTDEIDYYIKSRNLAAIRAWIQIQKTARLDLCTVAQLRKIAQRYNVYNYHIIRRDQLIEEIKKCHSPSFTQS